MLSWFYKHKWVDMLAEIGFIATGLCFGAFAYTFKTIVIARTKYKLDQFAYAYGFLALALIVWGVSVAIGGSTLLKNSVLIGDFFLLCGSLFMFDLLLDEANRFWIVPAGALALILFYIRCNHYLPSPYMQNSVLVFNTQTPVALTLGAIFLLVWLPVNLKVAKLVARRIKGEDIGVYYSAVYTTATFSALVFLAARKTWTVILSFLAIGICFAMLMASNLLIEKVKLTNGTK